jgi:predicted short-subunit dehydrogenase-like oxidoreductase (DUF2520 family)
MSRKAAQAINSQHIVLLGCGNLAWHLALALKKINSIELSICNHRANPALDEFRFKLKCKTFVGFENMPSNGTVYIICVADKFITETAEQILSSDPKTIIVHTSGSMSLKAFGERVQSVGVLYPLQSFTKSDVLPWEETPLLIEASDIGARKKIELLAKQISPKVCYMTSEQRLQLHLCAVLVNNFTNALYAGAEQHLSAVGKVSDFKLLLPLIRTGVRKLDKMPAIEAQTGPAKRGDKKVMQKHTALLKKEPVLKKIYKEMSKLIKEQQHART